MPLVYRFKSGFRLNGDPQVVGETLEALRVRNGGQLTPEDVVVEAAKRRSVLGQYFEWDDTEAAQQHRLFQAKCLVGSVVAAAQGGLPLEPARCDAGRCGAGRPACNE